jgi:hypothetical protein
MPLQKLQFRPGVNREGTTLSNEGGWFDCDKIRFRSGYPEKLGGWVKDTGTEYPTSPTATFAASGTTTSLQPTTGSFWGVCRSIFNWLTLAGFNLASLGTNLKYYIQNSVNGSFYDVTPVRYNTAVASNAFTTTYPATATTVTCNVTAHGAQVGDFVIISGVSGPVNGIPAATLNAEFRVVSVPNSNQFTITVGSGATSAGTTGAATFNFQATTGNEVYSVASGWGAGGWGGVTTGFPSTGWGLSAATGIGVNLRLWSQSNFGENLIFNARGGAMNFWAVNPSPTVFDRGQVITAGGTITQKNYATGSGTTTVSVDATCPSQVNYVLVSDASRFTIAFGCNDPTGVYASTVLDPLLVRWSDQESYSTWTPSATNQAGDYRLSTGSQIITAIQTRQEILVLTDAAIYSMQFLGAPYVWGFQIMGDNISIIGPNAAITVNNVTYWMGADKFYMYSGRVETLPCALRQYIYDDINLDQGYQVFAGTNEGYNEIWWYYCSANSTTVDKYVIYNHLERTWYYGTMARTAWDDSPLRLNPMAAGYNGQLIYHESGNDDGTTSPASPIVSYVQSSDFDIGDGHNFGFVWRLIPDITFDGSNVAAPNVNFTVLPRTNPGANYGSSDNPAVVSVNNYAGQRTYNVQQFTQQVYVRIRGRQMAFKVGSTGLGVSWQLGSPRIDVTADGRR